MAAFDVLLPVRNGIDWFAEALQSIARQTHADWRVLVLDHGSDDGSLELAQRLAERDARFVVHSFPAAAGLADLLNRGLALCDCRYVLRQDADDVSLPERMALLASCFSAHPEVAVIGSLGRVIDARGTDIGAIDMPTARHGVAAAALFRTPISHPTAAMRLETLHRLGARYGEDFIGALPPQRRLHVPGLAEDYFLFGQLALVTDCVNLAQPLVNYRWHGGNVGAARFLDQMRTALAISRNLAATLACMKGIAEFDPAPFCNHGERLFDMDGRLDFRAEFAVLRDALRRAWPDNPDLERELAFRGLFARRSRMHLLPRLAPFAARHGLGQTEWRTLRSWLLREMRPGTLLNLGAGGLHHA